MKNKRVDAPEEALRGLADGATVMVGGFGRGGVPEILADALCEMGYRDLVIVSNNAGTLEIGIERMLMEDRVRKVICSFPLAKESHVFAEKQAEGKVELELVPQGTLAERIRAGGAGLGGFLTAVGLGTELAEGKPVIELDGRSFLLERALHADLALVKADRVDERGNLTYRKAARNFNPDMAMAA